jgi:putative aldouronate transport system permease protein
VKLKINPDTVFVAGNTIFMLLVLFMMLYPLYFAIIVSISDPNLVATGFVTLFPKGFTLEAYQNVFVNSEIWTGYTNTIFYTAFGTLWNLVLTMPTAYVLSKKRLHGRSLLAWFFLFTMYFSGGLVPFYLLVKSLGLQNQRITLILLGGLSVYDMIVTRIYFQTSIPDELYESARIDGASDFRMFFRIALPLAKPILAVMVLFYGVGRWNDYFTALIFITNKNLSPLQIVLRNILILNESMRMLVMQGGMSSDDVSKALRRAYLANAMKYALIFIASAPLLAAYPFVQKYFVKGIMIGSLKG